jgi:O-acetyl-ADP-ribose deacetylase (regulator of RNase III)
MIEPATGNLFEAHADALVNTVNCVGIMGKGIALQFKQAYPEMFASYERAARAGEIQPGRMHLFQTGRLWPQYIINFPTKRHWRGKSRLDDVEAGLRDLVKVIQELDIQSVAIPPLGSGNGGLDWNAVRPRILGAFDALPHVRVFLYEPRGEPLAKDRITGTERPSLTPARALYLAAMGAYRSLEYSLTLLEVQKLAYFLQVAGAKLQLQFERGPYGPYAHNLNQVLRRLEGHYLYGATDTKPSTEIELATGAVDEANGFLNTLPEAQPLSRLTRLIEGFETPYGMELLATVHWVVNESPVAADDFRVCLDAVQSWNSRKRQVMKPQHVKLAWDRLKSEQWFGPES